MWWNKKEGQVEEPKKELVIKKRIKALYDKLVKIQDTINDSNLWSYEYIDRYTYSLEFKSNQYKGYCINTIYGKRRIVIKDGIELFYGDENLFTMNEFYISGMFPHRIDFMFAIKFRSVEVVIMPYPMTKFTPKEIDLAILEFENAIEPIYQEALKRESKHKACIKYFSEVNNEQ